jgi:hypothetical protein
LTNSISVNDRINKGRKSGDSQNRICEGLDIERFVRKQLNSLSTQDEMHDEETSTGYFIDDTT